MKPARNAPVSAPPAASPPPRFVLDGVVILVVALAVRVAYLFQIRPAPFFTVLVGDARGYDAWAQRIAGGDWIGQDVFYQAPLYPYFLGTIYALIGRDLLAVRLIQAGVGAAACVLLALAARRLFSSRKAGLAAGLGLALYAPAIFFDGLIQKSVLDVFFVCLALWLTSELVDAPERPRLWLFLGLAMGGLSLTRENALVLVAVVLLWALVGNGRARALAGAKAARRSGGRQPASRRALGAAAFLLGLALILLPVAARNYAVGGGFFLTPSQFGPNLFIGNNPNADGTYASLRFGRGAPEYERQDATELAEHAAGRRLSPAEVSSYWTDRALDFITMRPGDWLALMGRKVVLLWNATEMLDTESQETYAEWSPLLRALGWVGHFGVLVPLALLGVWATWGERRRLWVFHAMLLAYAASVLLFYVFARYRFPMVPLLMLFAAAGMLAAAAFAARAMRGDRVALAESSAGTATVAGSSWLRWQPGRREALALAAALVVAVAFTNWPVLSKPLMQAVTENNLGTALQAEGRYEDAIAHYRRALTFSPDYVPAYNNMGTAFRVQGQIDRAVETYERAIALRPDYPDAHYNLANVLLDRNQPEKAAEHFRLALRVIPGSAHVHNNLGIALASEGRIDEAILQFREAVKADPDSPAAHRNLADALATRRQMPEAVATMRRAAELAPGDGAMHYDYGSVLLEAGRAAEAEAAFRRSLEVRPDSAEAHNNLGIALGSQGRLDEAIGHFERALKLQPAFADAQRNLALAREAAREPAALPGNR